MKRIVALLLVLVFAFGLSACKENDTVSDLSSEVITESETEKVDDNDSSSSEIDKTDEVSSESEPEESKPDESTLEASAPAESEPAESKPAESKPTESTPATSESVETSKPDESKPTHSHTYSAATCIVAKKCSCGATEGSPLGHKWTAATCTAAKTCSVCKVTEGSALGHSFTEGVCTVCKEKDPNFKYQPLTTGEWSASTELNGEFLSFTLTFNDEGSFYSYQTGGMGDGDSFEYTEVGNSVTVIDSSSKKMVLERTSNDTLKIISSEFSLYGMSALVKPGVELKLSAN